LHHIRFILAPSSLFAPCTYRIFDGQIFNGPDRKVACSIRYDVRELAYFSMIVRMNGYGERARHGLHPPPGEQQQENQVPESPKTQRIVRTVLVRM
jgi:hypothetical protein